MKSVAAALLFAGIAVAGCGDTRIDPPVPGNAMPTTALSEISDAQWQALASRRIFFGHQSVGRNIIAGMRAVLEEHPEIPLRIVNAADPANVDGAAFIEADVGQNTKPDTKADAFAKALDGGFGSEPGAVAMYKYCYVDMQPDTDPDALFADYVRRTEAIRARYPGLTVVHFTMPLWSEDVSLREKVKALFGASTLARLNIQRNRYNDLLRDRYGADEPLFDLAMLESTRADGSRTYTNYRGRPIFKLVPEWTDDGGHLKEEAQVRIAEQLLVFLAELPRANTAESGASDASGASR